MTKRNQFFTTSLLLQPALILAVSSSLSFSQDVYENGILNIDKVYWNDKIYSEVQVDIKNIIDAKMGSPLATVDGYYPSTNQLFIPEAIYKEETYTNVTVEIGNVYSAGEVLDIYNSPVYSYPTNIEEISYPQSYLNSAGSHDFSSRDPCNLDIETIHIPQYWMGYYDLPSVKGAPYPEYVNAGIGIKDIFLTDNPAFILNDYKPGKTGCDGTSLLTTEIDRTLERYQNIGVEYVFLPQWHWMEILSDGSWQVRDANETFGPAKNEDLEYFVRKAKTLGLKVFMINDIDYAVYRQSDGWYDGSSAHTPEFNEENFQKWLDAYTRFVEEKITFYEEIGVDVLELTCYCMFGPHYPSFSNSNYQDYLDVVKSLKELLPNTGIETAIRISAIQTERLDDFISIADTLIIEGNPNIDDLPDISVESIRENYELYELDIALPTGKDIIFTIFPFQSRENALTTPGYLEETVCTSQLFTFNLDNQVCLQDLTYPDFSLQAVTFEGALEAINQKLPATYGGEITIMSLDTWMTDVLLPYTAFPNLGNTIRNKPAEGIFKKWFSR